MTEKSHVGMGFKLCPVCGVKHDEMVLLDKQLKNSLERDNFMSFELCPEHDAMKKEFVALVEISNSNTGMNLKPADAIRTGQIAHVKREVAPTIFNVAFPEDLNMVYVEVGVISQLQGMVE